MVYDPPSPPHGAAVVKRGALDRTSTAARAAERLRERIAAGDLEPGARIVELDVARELGVSRSPVREALLKLAEEGLVTIVPYRGAVVAPLAHDRLRDLLEVRLAIERFALESLIAKSDAKALARLKEDVVAIADAIAAGATRRAVEADLEMHRRIVDLTGNGLLARTYEGLLNQVRLYIRVTSARYERLEDLADEHVALLDAIERRDVVQAQRVLDAHILHGFDEAALRPSS